MFSIKNKSSKNTNTVYLYISQCRYIINCIRLCFTDTVKYLYSIGEAY